MPMVPFGEYRPDISDRNTDGTNFLSNVLPRADGYGPFHNFDALTAALPEKCRGFFFARNDDGTVAIFAATANRIYLLSNTTFQWSDVSKGGSSYAAPDNNRNWRFAQFNNLVIAVNRNVPPQVYNLASPGAFADLGGSPPQSGYVTVVNRFLVLCDMLSYPYRIQWSGLNETDNWTPGDNYSDYQDLATGGVPKAIIGGELGMILQDTEIRRMTFSPGSEIVFQIDKIAENIGLISSDGAVAADNQLFFYSSKGFLQMGLDGSMMPIGFEKVDRTFSKTLYDDTAPQYLIAAADPREGVVVWAFRRRASNDPGCDYMIAYNYNLQRWSPIIDLPGEYISSLAQPGFTLEALDAIMPGAVDISGAADNGSGLIRLTVASTSGWTTGDSKTISAVAGTTEANGTWTITVIDGTHIDLQGSTFTNAYTSGGVVGGSFDDSAFPFDSYSTQTLPRLAFCTRGHAIGFFVGASLEATLGIPESQLDLGYRVDVNGMIPVTDAPTVYGYIKSRDRVSDTVADSSEALANSDGFVPALVNARLARGVIRIPAGTEWTFASGIEPVFQRAGMY